MGLVATGGKPHTWADTFMSLGSGICQHCLRDQGTTCRGLTMLQTRLPATTDCRACWCATWPGCWEKEVGLLFIIGCLSSLTREACRSHVAQQCHGRHREAPATLAVHPTCFDLHPEGQEQTSTPLHTEAHWLVKDAFCQKLTSQRLKRKSCVN